MYHPEENNNNQYNPNGNNEFQNNQTNPTSSWQVYHPEQQGFQSGSTGGNFSGADGKVKKAPNTAVKITAVLLACLLVGGGAGFGGSFLAQRLMGGDNQPSVIKQSVVNTTQTSAGNESAVADVAAAAADSVVEITTETVSRNNFLQQYTTTGAGSGVILTEDGYIITNNHVIEGANTIKVRLRNGTEYDATLVGTDAESDVAVIKVEASGLTTAVIGDSDTLAVGELAVAIGNPLGELGGSVTEGVISALDRQITIEGQTMNLLQTSAAINPGNSGGGLFNAKGELIGIVNAKTSEAGIEGLGFAIPINHAMEIAEELMTNGYVTGRVKLGVSLLKIPDESTAMQYGVSSPGVYVAQVTANSDAYYGGLRVADRIISVNGKNVEETQDVKDVVENSNVGDVLTMQIARGTQQMEIKITLTEYNSNAANFAQ